MRKQFVGRFTTRHCRRLVLQLRRQLGLIDIQDDQVALPAIKPISSVDHLCERRAMDKPLRAQTVGRISPPPDSKHPLTTLDDMYDHSPSLDTFQIARTLPLSNSRAKVAEAESRGTLPGGQVRTALQSY